VGSLCALLTWDGVIKRVASTGQKTSPPA